MSYNNNNCGMHMVPYPGHWQDEDARYEDRVAEEQRYAAANGGLHSSSKNEDADTTAPEIHYDYREIMRRAKTAKSSLLTGKSAFEDYDQYAEIHPDKGPSLYRWLTRHLKGFDCYYTIDFISGNIMSEAILQDIDSVALFDEEEAYMKQFRKIDPDTYRKYEMTMPFVHALGKNALALNFVADKLGVTVDYLLENHPKRRAMAADLILDKIEDGDLLYFWDMDIRKEKRKVLYCECHGRSLSIQKQEVILERDGSDPTEYCLQYGQFFMRSYTANPYLLRFACIVDEINPRGRIARAISKIRAENPDLEKECDEMYSD